jgi:hypothetical protein
MKKIFLSYHFDPQIVPLANNVKRLINSHDLMPVDGERLAGQPLTEGVKNAIKACEAMIILLTKREEGRSNDWVKHERTTAYNFNIPFIAVIENGVVNNGPFEAFEYINYDSEDFLEPILKLSETIFKWKLQIGNMVEAYLEPDEIADKVRENLDREEVVRYRFFDERVQWSEWMKPVIKPTAGGISLYLNGVKKNSEIQVQVRTNDKSWNSDVINQNLRILVQ